MINKILISIGLYIGIDYIMSKYNIEGRYYFNHIICNSIVVYNTFNGMLNSYNINSIITNDQIINLYTAKIAIYGLHIYHTIYYFNKLRRDDWLHHILMIGIVLPLTEIVPEHNIYAHGIFFTTGLPGLIDYVLLFLNRNSLLPKIVEKKINTLINLWLRAPGCIMNLCLTITNIINYHSLLSNYQIYSGILMGSLVYWNGIYFMEQTVVDYTKYNLIRM